MLNSFGLSRELSKPLLKSNTVHEFQKRWAVRVRALRVPPILIFKHQQQFIKMAPQRAFDSLSRLPPFISILATTVTLAYFLLLLSYDPCKDNLLSYKFFML